MSTTASYNSELRAGIVRAEPGHIKQPAMKCEIVRNDGDQYEGSPDLGRKASHHLKDLSQQKFEPPMCGKYDASPQEDLNLESNIIREHLMRWFKQNGGTIDEAIDLVYNPEYGYHYIAKSRAINAHEIVCTCPFTLTLSHLNALPTPSADIHHDSEDSVCAKLVGQIDHGALAAFYLAEQRLKGNKSFWYYYVQTLPSETEMTTPLWFSNQELAHLTGTNLLPHGLPREQTSVGLWESRHKEQWTMGISALKEAGESTDDFTWQLFLWAVTIFTSRSFASGRTTGSDTLFDVLYPVIDIFNHHFDAKVKWQSERGSFSLQVEERVEQGQQIFNNYAAKGNEELLMGYGFCIADNPCDQVAFRLGQVSTETHVRLRERIPSHWQSESWNPQESVFYIRDCLRGIPPELTISVYVIMLASREDASYPERTEDAMYVWAGVIDTLLQQTEASLLAITRWDSELPEAPLTAGARAAMVYRTGQSRILKEVISDLKAFIYPLKSGEIDIEDAFRGKVDLV